jgi:hypothetical protein
MNASLAQSVERETLNLKVAGSTPAWGLVLSSFAAQGERVVFLGVLCAVSRARLRSVVVGLRCGERKMFCAFFLKQSRGVRGEARPPPHGISEALVLWVVQRLL